jgi:hypothetical protein
VKKWESKVRSEKFNSSDELESFVTEIGKLGWELVSLFPCPFPPKIPELGEQVDCRTGVKFTLAFKREAPLSG